jgi:hypothetical protein
MQQIITQLYERGRADVGLLGFMTPSLSVVSLTSRREHELQVLRKIFGTKGDEIRDEEFRVLTMHVCNEELRDSNSPSSSPVVRVVKSRKL